MAIDYIPATDGDFQAWLDNFSALITAAPTDYGLTTGNATTLSGLTTTYDAAFLAATNGSTRGPSTVSAKDTARANAEAYARQLASIIQVDPTVTNTQKTNLRLTVRKTSKSPIPAPVTHPQLRLVSVSNLGHTLRYNDETTPSSSKRPFGATALLLIWWINAAGTPPSGPPTDTALVTRNPVTIDFSSGDVTKVVTYSARWATATGLLGPLSNNVSGTVIGTTD